MRETFKLAALAIVSMGAMARSCVKTGARVTEFSDPVITEARYMKNVHTIEANRFTTAKALKTGKNMTEIADVIRKSNEKDTVKNVKQVRTMRKMKK
ncbi:hypothetical protein HNP38_003250 [Chryseobacterium defluvii]|uniref:Uncharacterized protein n=1 Tax=Chryseobacterium defluvii TaxID=160396 RepID=A0A840KJU1_9FLAO|nr:hypothetical protein [Chryseobacterium defluvii]MBB4807934.1 hypothetical protein [Chryseobacterium defluvii]